MEICRYVFASLSLKLHVHRTTTFLSTAKGSSFICKACFKSSVVETQYIHNPLIHANIKGLLCSGLCGSQCVWVWRAAACVWCSRSGCTNSALRRGDAPLQLLLIRKSIWVRHQIVYVVCRKGTGTSVCVCGEVLMIHLSLFPPQSNMVVDSEGRLGQTRVLVLL